MARILAVASIGLAACGTPSRLAFAHLDSLAMHGRAMAYAVYAPPGWSHAERLPLVVFLHGGGGDGVSCLEEAGVVAQLDRDIAEGRLRRVVILVPQGDRGFWANWADGSRRYEDWVIREAMPEVVRDYGTLPCPEGCHVMGVSMGGNGALRFALKHPGLFASVGILSGPTFDAKGMQSMMDNGLFRYIARLDRVFGSAEDAERLRQADPFQQWQSPADVGALRIFVARGTSDRSGIAPTNDALDRHLTEHGILHRYVVFNGGHRWQDWRPVISEAIRYAVSNTPGREAGANRK